MRAAAPRPSASFAPEDIDEPPARPPLRPVPVMPVGPPVPPPTYAPPVPDRSGATFEMSLGFGATHVSLDNGLSETFNGISGLNLGLGGWVSPRTALTLRLAGTSFVERVGGFDVRFIAGLFGLSMQHMVSNELWIGIGGGVGVLTTDQDDIEPETGFALDLRAGINLVQSAHHALHLAIEVTPGFYDGLNVTGIGLQLGWQAL
ncbi:MAG TPA: hypothetical protein VK932_12315 [Kofleriaceae bacterium]|nr:hypothetical protein [Kofleriaceae bacterium]